MKIQTDNDFDKLFKDKLGEIELVPSERVWKYVAKDISLPIEKEKGIPLSWLIAASISLLFVLSLVLIPGKEPIKLQASTQSAIEYKKPAAPVIAKRNSARKQKGLVFLDRLASMQLERKKQLKSYKITENAIADHVDHIPSLTKVNVEKLAVNLREETPVMASIPTSIAMDDPIVPKELNQGKISRVQVAESAYREPQTGIRSVGDIVNFVVRHVDHRDEKIIEFSNHDEGSSLSGINLGLIKIRAKQNDIKSN